MPAPAALAGPAAKAARPLPVVMTQVMAETAAKAA
jgi:hypothetical protein